MELIRNTMARYIDVKDNLKLELNNSEVITLMINDNCDIEYKLSNGDYKVLVFNNSDHDLIINEKGTLDACSLEINYIDLNTNKFKQSTNIELINGSSINVNSIYLGINTKSIVFDIVNSTRDTLTNISNNVVALKDSDITLDVIGTIKKGAKNSKCYQKSRCLTLDKPKQAKILPVLNIDENDVEASHSLSSGTIDENILFYMNSRGLNRKQALILMISSYLIPDDSFYEEFEKGEEINKIVKEKVNNLCLM